MRGTQKRVDRGVGIYVRKSSEKQGELSLPAQERLIRAQIIEPAKLPVYAVYEDILSGTRPDRSGYQQMLADARAGKLTAVAFHKVNRFGRNAAEGLMAVEELRSLGVAIRIADLPNLDISRPEGMFIFTFLLGQGQYEVENLGSEAKKGMQEKLWRGGWPFRAPDGYVNLREEVAPRKFRAWLGVERRRAAIVRLMYLLYAPGTRSLTDVARHLNRLHRQRLARGRPGCAQQSGSPWSARRIWDMLRSRFYIGEVSVAAWNYTGPGIHTPIVPRALFDRVQQVLEEHGKGPYQNHAYLLQDLLFLEPAEPLRCTTVERRGRTYTYYYRTAPDAARRYYDAGPIDAAVAEALRAALACLGPEPAAVLAERLTAHTATAQAAAHVRLDELYQQRQRVLHFAATGRFSEAEVAGELSRIQFDIDAAQRDVAQAALLATMHASMLLEAQSTLASFARWDALSVAERHELVRALVQRVTIGRTGELTGITWHLLWETVLGG